MIRAVGRAVAIFDAFDDQHLSLSLQEIGERIQMPKATTFRLVNSLERAGFLVRCDNHQYCLSLKIVRLAGLVKGTIGIRDIARPTMIEVAKETRETITLNALSGNHRLCIEVLDTPSPLMSIVQPGEYIPLLFGATGRVLLAYRSPEELESILASTPSADKIDRAALDRELSEIRERGYALTSGQRIPGITAIAVPLHDMNENVQHTLALSGPSVRVDPQREKFIKILLEAGADISRRLGSKVAARETDL